MLSSSSTIEFESDEVVDRFLANVDVWKTIFEMLSVKDRIRLEMTNTRLHILMFTCWKGVTSFDSKKCHTEMCDNPSINNNRWAAFVAICVSRISDGLRSLKSDSFSMNRNAEKLSAAFVAICVNRIGDGLRSLTIREKFFPSTFWSATLASIGQGCPNVETINFVFQIGYATLDIRFDSFSRLKMIIVSTARGVLFPSASASVFLSIPTSIEVIRGLGGGTFEHAAQMEGFFADRPSLREVDHYELNTRDESKADIFRVIAERCPHLKSITLSSCCDDYIDYSGVVALESMKELRILDAVFDEMEIVTICERSPLVEALEFGLTLSSNIDLQSPALNALGSITKLAELSFYTEYGDVVAPSLVTKFVLDLARNSGASLRHLQLAYGDTMTLPTEAIEALANGCPKLRYVRFGARVGEAEPASIRFLIDCIVADPSWIPQTSRLEIIIPVKRDSGHEYNVGIGAFYALAAANLPTGVRLSVC